MHRVSDFYVYNDELVIVLKKGLVYAPTGLHYVSFRLDSIQGFDLNKVVPCNCKSCMEK